MENENWKCLPTSGNELFSFPSFGIKTKHGNKLRHLTCKDYKKKNKFNREFKKAEEALKKAKKDAEHHSTLWKQREQEFETLRLEVQELETAVANSTAQLQEMEASEAELNAAMEAATAEHEKTTVIFNVLFNVLLL